MFKQVGCSAVEFMLWMRNDPVEKFLIENPKEVVDGFQYVSLHAPGIPYVKSDEVFSLFEIIQNLHDKFAFKAIVFHPDMVKDWDLFNNLRFPIAFENMDNQKDFGISIEDMEIVFEKTDSKMVFDIQHIYSNDSSMKLGYEMLEKFKERIVEIHFSSLNGGKSGPVHKLAYQSPEQEILNILKNTKIPILFEGVVDPNSKMEDIRKEFGFTQKFLSSRQP